MTDDAARSALHAWSSDSDRLEAITDAYHDFLLWEPGKRGYAAAARRFVAVVDQVLGLEGKDA